MRGVRFLIEDRALRPVLVIWAFAYLLADITVTAMGRMGPGVRTIVSIPLFAIAITFTMLLERLRQRMQSRPRLLGWAGFGAGVLVATATFIISRNPATCEPRSRFALRQDARARRELSGTAK